MNETITIKMRPQFIPLCKEHQDGLLFAQRIRDGFNVYVTLERIRRYALWYWKKHIMPHFFQEEKILVPCVPPDDAMTLQMKGEHDQIRELILGLDRDADKQGFMILCDLIEKHIYFEERKLFPYLERNLTVEQLNTIHWQLAEHPFSSEEWKDKFWSKNNAEAA
jgi:hemerythrin-like domain-containing protein